MVHRIDVVAMNAEVTRGSRFWGAEAVTQVTGSHHKKFGLRQAVVIERKFWTRKPEAGLFLQDRSDSRAIIAAAAKAPQQDATRALASHRVVDVAALVYWIGAPR